MSLNVFMITKKEYNNIGGRAGREAETARFEDGEFVEMFVNTPLDVAEQRDPKGLYNKARRGGIPNFTDINSPYEAPKNPDFEVDTSVLTSEHIAEQLVTNVISELELQQ